MKKELQITNFRKMLEKRGVASDKIDLNAQIDASLSFHENLVLLQKLVPELHAEITAKEVKTQERKAFLGNQERAEQLINEFFTQNFGEREGTAQEIWGEITAYSPHTERVTLSTLLAINQGGNVLNHSPFGKGKSRGNAEFSDNKLLDYPITVLAGHLAPTDVFNYLADTRGLLVWDESVSAFRDKDILALLLSALWNKKVRWRNEEKDVKCDIIFNTNSYPRSPEFEALSDRFLAINRFTLSEQQIKDKIFSKRTYKPNLEVWAKIGANLRRQEELTLDETNQIYELIKVIQVDSCREDWRLLKIARFCKALFGSLYYLHVFVDFDKVQFVLNSALPRSEKVKVLEELGFHERKAQRVVKESVEATKHKV